MPPSGHLLPDLRLPRAPAALPTPPTAVRIAVLALLLFALGVTLGAALVDIASHQNPLRPPVPGYPFLPS